MSGPKFGLREAQTHDHLLDSKQPWDELDSFFEPYLADRPLQPSDRVAKNLATFAKTAGGREILEWIMDITLRAPLRVTGSSLEETALRAATKQGINGPAEAILNAIEHGETLLNQGKGK
ncbi:MAG: hypothetical protein JJ866_15765 [Roseibium sp.]|uniref:hypothetical protein n=1 Tax=Roseibium sp. TaxID=1936156 RepID=UPI001B023B2D|nr:hypothetical protein [Roseibium sp.]MBO6893400.1 hypothetical protein [Roseibium sp.]MBO6930724.1 hypothetical protein [Roseibium sp.]